MNSTTTETTTELSSSTEFNGTHSIAESSSETTTTVSGGVNKIVETKPTWSSHKEDRFLFTESSVEYYYYRQPVVVKVQPSSGLTQGGTPIEVSGAWFD